MFESRFLRAEGSTRMDGMGNERRGKKIGISNNNPGRVVGKGNALLFHAIS